MGPLRVFTQIKKYQTTLLANGQEEATQDLWLTWLVDSASTWKSGVRIAVSGHFLPLLCCQPTPKATVHEKGSLGQLNCWTQQWGANLALTVEHKYCSWDTFETMDCSLVFQSIPLWMGIRKVIYSHSKYKTRFRVPTFLLPNRSAVWDYSVEQLADFANRYEQSSLGTHGLMNVIFECKTSPHAKWHEKIYLGEFWVIDSISKCPIISFDGRKVVWIYYRITHQIL